MIGGMALVYVQEFEFVEEEGAVIALPCGLPGATEGTDLADAVSMAADWLYEHVISDLAAGRARQPANVGNAPERGGTVIAVAVRVGIEDVPAITAAEAARRLGVSTARVAQLCRAGELDSWRVGSARMVSIESVEYRLAARPHAGRPRRAALA